MMTDIDKYLSFVLTMFIAFGLTFEMPVVVIVLVRMRMVTLEKLRAIALVRDRRARSSSARSSRRRTSISQLLLAMPLWLLYELGHADGALHRAAGADDDDGSSPTRRDSG